MQGEEAPAAEGEIFEVIVGELSDAGLFPHPGARTAVLSQACALAVPKKAPQHCQDVPALSWPLCPWDCAAQLWPVPSCPIPVPSGVQTFPFS